MEIAIIADETKKELMTQFCIAYSGILANHNLCATRVTGECIAEATGLTLEYMLPGDIGGVEQIISRLAYNEIDMLLYFRDSAPEESPWQQSERQLLRECDINNVPVATNIATAEVLVMALERGSLDWREIVNPRSEYNQRRKGKA